MTAKAAKKAAGKVDRGALGRVALVLGSSLVALLLIELAVRTLLPGWRPPDPDGVEFFAPDELLGWRLVPEYVGELDLFGSKTRIEIDQAGLRDSTVGSRPGATRLLLLGDSFGFGFGVEEEDGLATVLEQLRPDLEVINASVPGYGTDQQLIWLREHGADTSPDVVLLLFHANDLLNNTYARQYGYPKPRYQLEAGELVLGNVPVPLPGLWQRLELGALRRSWVLYRGARLLTARSERAAEREPPQNLFDAPQLAFDVTEQLLLALAEEARGLDARLVVVGIPWPSAEIQEMVDRVTAFGAEQGIEVLDIEAAFEGRWSSLMEQQTEHWTPAGHRVAAEEIARGLERKGLLAARP